jgi:hypothetical protein
MGYFDNLAAASFKVDSSGRTVFFPWGIIGKGYVLKNKLQEQELKKIIKIYHITSLVLVLIFGPFLQLWVLCAAVVPFAVIIWIFKAKKAIAGLPVSGEKLKYSKNLKRMFK